MRRNRNSLGVAISTAWLLFAVPAHAGGLYLSTFGTPSMGTASAGANAIAHDASTAFHNPAGMTRLDDHQALMGLAPGFSTVEFDPDADTPTPGNDGNDQGGLVPISSSSYVHKLSERWRLGFNLFSVSGAALNPNDRWTGQNEVTKLSLFSLSFIPTVAVRLTDWLSVGAGAAVSYGKVDMQLRLPIGPDPTIKLEDLEDWEVAPLASLLLEPCDGLRIGVLYQGETDFELDGDVEIPVGAGSPGINLELPLAQAVRTSLYWDATDAVALLVSGGWEDWSTAKELPISAGGVSGAIPLEFQDTWYAAAGVHYRASEKWVLKTGFRYDSSALADRDRTTAFPIDRILTFGVGGSYDWSEKLNIGVNFSWADLGTSSVDTAFVHGSYEKNDLFLFGLSFSWKKLPWSGRGTF